MEKIIIFVIAFIIVYLAYLLTVVLQKRKMDKFKKSSQIQFFVKKYNLQFKNITVQHFSHMLALGNAFIVAFTLAITDFVSNFLLRMLLAFVILIPLILIVYGIIGKYMQKKEGQTCIKPKK